MTDVEQRRKKTFGMLPDLEDKNSRETNNLAENGEPKNSMVKNQVRTTTRHITGEKSRPFASPVAKRDILCTFVHSNITDKNVDGLQTCTDSNEIGVKGSLKQNLSFRKESIKPSPFVLNVLEHGYVLPLTSIPPPFIAKNNQSALKYPVFVDEAIKELLKYGYIEELSEPAYCCNPLTVADKGKLRLFLDFRHLNAYINVKKFRYEDLKVVTELFNCNEKQQSSTYSVSRKTSFTKLR